MTKIQDIDPLDFYKRSLKFKIDDKTYYGVASVKLKKKHEIKIYSKNRGELFRLSTCHRDFQKEDPKRKFEYDYSPTKIESDAPCPLDIVVFDDKRAHEWAYIDFVTNEKLVSTVHCNGKVKTNSGTSLCQSKIGLLQLVSFERPVKYKSKCLELKSKDSKNFYYNAIKGKCLVVFYNEKKEYHRFISLGYSKILFTES